jgi:hypothetical protein
MPALQRHGSQESWHCGIADFRFAQKHSSG